MKRAFTCLFILMLFLCGKQGYDQLVSNDPTGGLSSGSLSDIAEEVIAVPLQKAGKSAIKHAHDIQQEKNNLFLVNEGILYRFNRKGEFICRITNPEDIQVAKYVINPVNRQLIVLGNSDDIFYYSFEGILLTRKKPHSNQPGQHLLSITMHNNRILTTEEHVTQDPGTHRSLIEKQVVEYDLFFNKIRNRKIANVNLERSGCTIGCLFPLISIEKYSGSIYAYEPSRQPDNLLRDSLYLRQKRQSQALADFTDKESLPLLPIRMGSRFWLSTYYNTDEKSNNYIFCYDTVKNQCWYVKEGLKDNFYQTGTVQRLDAMDPYSQSYSFCKSGEELKKAFPGNEESLVLFIVKLKS